jgi:hypothetical protein
MLTLYKDSDNLIRWDEMKNVADDTYVNDATVTFTLRDEDATAISGATDVPMSYVASSNGRYQGTLQSTVSLLDPSDPSRIYLLDVSATSGGTLVGFRRIPCKTAWHDED